MQNKQEITNWVANLKRDLAAFEEALNNDSTHMVFETFNDVEHDYTKLAEQVDAIDVPDTEVLTECEHAYRMDAASATGMYD